MSKQNSSNSNNSGTSSETSETQSLDDTNQSISASPTAVTSPTVTTTSRIPKSWQRMSNSNNDKDSEAKRPPWRAVSVSTLPKPDKNALLRAKLLDASRRLRAGRNSVAIQTDIVSTKLMKEVNLEAQPDLILCKEIGILTDGSYAKRRDGSDEFILTYSVSQVTDAVPVADAETQTLLPKIPADDFIEAYSNTDRNLVFENKFTDTERTLLEQICKIRKDNSLRNQKASFAEGEVNAKFATASLPTPSLLHPTFSSWNFDYNEIGSELSKNFEAYVLYPSNSWRSCSSFDYQSGCLAKRHHDLASLLVGIDDILEKSNRLVDIIEDLRTTQNVNTLPKSNFVKIPPNNKSLNNLFPSEYWLPIIETQEKDLNDMLRLTAHKD